MRNKFRAEMKFLIPEYLHTEMRQLLREQMLYDRHTDEDHDHEYNVRSLYFDDFYGSAYEEKQQGIRLRKKYRIRTYDCGEKSISLECKHKDGAYVGKESVRITKEEYERIIAGEITFLLKKEEPLAQEFFVDARRNLLRPRVIVEYDREPFVCKVGNVRITFDKKIRALSWREDLFDPCAQSFAVLPQGQMILEVKYTDILPEKIRKLLWSFDLTQTSASKYCMCVDRMLGIYRK